MNSGIKLGGKGTGRADILVHPAGPQETGMIEMYYLKACRKCRGDLTLENDSYGDFLKCLQCGTYTEVEVHRPVLLGAGVRAVSGVKVKTEAA